MLPGICRPTPLGTPLPSFPLHLKDAVEETRVPQVLKPDAPLARPGGGSEHLGDRREARMGEKGQKVGVRGVSSDLMSTKQQQAAIFDNSTTFNDIIHQ